MTDLLTFLNRSISRGCDTVQMDARKLRAELAARDKRIAELEEALRGVLTKEEQDRQRAEVLGYVFEDLAAAALEKK